MAKIRGVKPEYWTDDAIVELSIPARLLFIGLWNFACDNGHLADKPKQLRMRIFPADEIDVDTLLDELEEHKRIVRKNGVVTIQKFAHHQKPHKRWWTTCDLPWCKRPATGDQPLSSPSDYPSQQGVNGWPTGDNGGSTADGDVEGDGDGDVDARERDFAAFYDTYPKKVGRGQAARAYKAALKKVDADTILGGLRRHLPVWERTERQFIPNPATWLNGERWADDVDSDDNPAPAGVPSVEQLVAERGW